MKTIIRKYLVAAGIVLFATSCLDDLNVVPINPSDFTSEAAYSTPESYKQGLVKLYGGFVLVGQTGPGDSEIDVKDAGASELNRAFWSLQEMTTDEAFCSWGNDAWVREINYANWTSAPNDGVAAVYYRTVLIATLCNEYLKQTSDDRLSKRGVDAALRAEIQKYRAEARFIRAYVYWMSMDVFGNPPFTTEQDAIGKEPPRQISRADLFAWLEGELKSLEQSPDLAEPKTNVYPRVDKSAAQALLARMYLNAQVYSGTPRWADAMTYAEKVIQKYPLANNYRALFSADNGKNAEAQKEIVFGAVYDRSLTQSYGGTTFMMNASYLGGSNPWDLDVMNENGQKEGWAGLRTSFDFATTYFNISNIDWNTGSYLNTDNDVRAYFSFKGRTKDFGADLFTFAQGVGVHKFTNLKADGTPNVLTTFSDTDFPLIRSGEMYLIYAEAAIRANQNVSTGLDYLKRIRERAQLDVTGLVSYNLNDIFKERSRELYWEGHRRTDLIRFGKFLSGYTWPFKGGVKEGVNLDSKYLLFPLIATDVAANPNLNQNTGY